MPSKIPKKTLEKTLEKIPKKSKLTKVIKPTSQDDNWDPSVTLGYLNQSTNDNPRQVFVSAAVIRPTGLIDPEIILKPTSNQVDDVIEQVRLRVIKNQRVIITTLTKKFAEELDLYFKQIHIKSAYIHSDVETLERLDILSDLRRGKYDVIIGINLLREGLDLPEVSLVAIFDADKEGFLRSRTSLIQIVGRAARHIEGQVIMYADKMTSSMQQAIDETNYKRELQTNYNQKHNITVKGATRQNKTIADSVREDVNNNPFYGQSRANLTVTSGFQEKKSDDFDPKYRKQLVEDNQAGELTIDNRFSKREKPLRKARAGQVYANFDTEVQQIQNDLAKQNLDSSELHERLQIAIDSYNFEEAAAIRNILGL